MTHQSIACLPIVDHIPKPRSDAWTKTNCPVCGKECWETDTYKWAKDLGIIESGACTDCVIGTHDGRCCLDD